MAAIGNFGSCCENCQIYWSCETKWYRGERHEKDTCCSTCNYYNECLTKSKKDSINKLRPSK